MSNTMEDQRLFEARLFLSSPETVFKELQERAAKIKSWGDFFRTDKQLEENLLRRNEALIDLGLAQYGGSKDVLKTLYARASDASGLGSEYSRRSIRIACLSNQVVTLGELFFDFPRDIIGEEALHGLLAGKDEKLDDDGFITSETGNEIRALLQNPKIDADLLEALYKRGQPFSDFSDDRWMYLVNLSSGNPRLTTCDDNEHGPDMGHRSIHGALYTLLEMAPVAPTVMNRLYFLYSRLDPSQVRANTKIDNIINRWSALEYKTSNGEDPEGVVTDLSMKDEFLCLIASLYGRYTDYTSKPSISEVIGTAKSEHVALRCAYYANVKLSKKEMEAGWERDGSAFLLAALRNDDLYYDRSRRKLLERHLGGSSANFYKKRCEQIHARRKSFDPKPIDCTFFDEDNCTFFDEDSGNPAETEPTWATKIQGQLQRLLTTTFVILYVCVAVATVFGSDFLSNQYGLPRWITVVGVWAASMFLINKLGPK